MQIGLILCGALLPVVSATLLGWGLARRWEVGPALLSVVYFGLFAVGWGNGWAFVGVLGGTAVFALIRGLRIRKPVLPGLGWGWLVALPYLLLYLVNAMAPEIQPDGYTYHLGLPAEWLRFAKFGPRLGFFEVLPQGVEVLFAPAILVGGYSAAKLVHFAFLLGAGWLAASITLRLGGSALAAGVLFAVTPVVGITGTAAYNDVALAFAVLAALRLYLEDQWLWAGMMAGYCYAIKPTGIWVAPVVVVLLVSQRQWRACLLATLGAAMIAGPWIWRAWWETGNPVAPLANTWFPNEWFHISTVDETAQWLRSYGVRGWGLIRELTIGGGTLGGVVGPVWLAAPAALLALFRRNTRVVGVFAVAALVPWMLNAGTRFLIPFLALAAVSLAVMLPRQVAVGLAVAHAVLSWPMVMDLYADPQGWRLRECPWRAALRIEPEPEYLRRKLWEYRVAEMVNAKVGRDEKLLDFVGAPTAYLNAHPYPTWQYASADLALDSIRNAMAYDHTSFYQVTATWPGRKLAGIRIVDRRPAARSWGIQEVAFLRGDQVIRPRLSWSIWAEPNGWESHLALDGNRSSRWQSWQEVRGDDYWQVEFPEPLEVSEARVLTFRVDAEMGFRYRAADGRWEELTDRVRTEIPVATALRGQAMSHVKRLGFRWILVRYDGEGLAAAGRQLVMHKGDWGLEEAGRLEGAVLLRIP